MASKPNWLIIRILKTKSTFFGTSTKHIQLNQLANVRNGIEHPFRNSMTGKGWIADGFLTRYRDKIVSLTPTDTSAAKTLGFNRENTRWGLPLYSQKYRKLLVSREKRQMANLTAAERGASITVMCCTNAAENFAPVMIIFPRGNEDKLLTKVALRESIATYHPSGWIQTPPLTQWIQRFVNFIGPSEESPVSLISDRRYSDTRNVDAIELSEKNFPSIVSLPSHSTHKLQLPDKTFMGPRKTYYSEEEPLFLRQVFFDIEELSWEAYTRNKEPKYKRDSERLEFIHRRKKFFAKQILLRRLGTQLL